MWLGKSDKNCCLCIVQPKGMENSSGNPLFRQRKTFDVHVVFHRELWSKLVHFGMVTGTGRCVEVLASDKWWVIFMYMLFYFSARGLVIWVFRKETLSVWMKYWNHHWTVKNRTNHRPGVHVIWVNAPTVIQVLQIRLKRFKKIFLARLCKLTIFFNSLN